LLKHSYLIVNYAYLIFSLLCSCFEFVNIDLLVFHIFYNDLHHGVLIFQGFLGRIDHFLINRSYNCVIEPMQLFIFGSIPLLSLYLEFFAFLLLWFKLFNELLLIDDKFIFLLIYNHFPLYLGFLFYAKALNPSFLSSEWTIL
jgi:hypothetical protein